MKRDSLEKIFDFLRAVNELKFTYRYSTNKLLNNESTAAHTWRLILLSMLIKQELGLQIDELKMFKIALVHDIAESITGDIDNTLIGEGKEDPNEKEKAEKKAINELISLLPEDLSKEIYGYWEDYQNQNCQEAKLIKTLDKAECQLHLLEKMPGSFMNESKANHGFHYADKPAEATPELKPMIELIKEKFIENGIKLPGSSSPKRDDNS